jgi:integrase/recombinase XerD
MPRRLLLSALVAAFLRAMEAENLSRATLGWYAWRLGRLVRATRDPPARALTTDALRTWLLQVRAGEQGRSTADSYVEGHRRAASALLNWAVREGHLEYSPLARIRRIRIERQELATLNADEVRGLIESQPTTTYAGRRNRAALALLYDTGIRVGELVALRPSDLDLEGRTLRVRGKARRDRRVPISADLARVLSDVVDDMHPRERLFTSAAGAPLRTTAVNQWLRRAALRAGITAKRVSPHVFRHSFATAYLRYGGDEFTLQTILGHATLDMVRRYVHLAETDVARRHASASPFSRIAKRTEE